MKSVITYRSSRDGINYITTCRHGAQVPPFITKQCPAPPPPHSHHVYHSTRHHRLSLCSHLLFRVACSIPFTRPPRHLGLTLTSRSALHISSRQLARASLSSHARKPLSCKPRLVCRRETLAMASSPHPSTPQLARHRRPARLGR
jgi:hypothetical protein